MENNFNTGTNLKDVQFNIQKVRESIGQNIIGQSEMIELLLIALIADGHVLLEGVPGVAKTLTAKLLARSIDTSFKRIQFTPDLMPSDIIGTSVFNNKTHDFEFRRGPIFANIVLVDEINRSPAKTQSALFEAMEERQVTADGLTYTLDYPFLVLATQNPVEHEGTYRLPEAQLDRFLMKIDVHYPTVEQESVILQNFQQRKHQIDVSTVSPVLTIQDIKNIRDAASKVHVDLNLIKYIAQIVNETRNNPSLFLGASPRASIALLASSKACAAINGKDFVTPEDIKFVAPHIIKHRILLTPEKEMEGATSHSIVKQILEKIEIPR